jgi:hypothetical protein
MLVSLHVRTWQAKKTDKLVSAGIAKQYSVRADVGAYRKKLLPDTSAEYEALVAATSALRNTFYVHTLPWAVDGARILSSVHYSAFTSIMSRLVDEFKKTVVAFLIVYPELRENARTVLNGLYNETDYPSVNAIQNRYSVSLDTYPIPTSNDFRVALSARDTESIRAQIEASVLAAVNTAQDDIRARLVDALEKMYARLRTPAKSAGSTFRDSLFENLAELCEILPAMSLRPDPQLSRVIADIRESILPISPDDCRTDASVRASTATEVERIMAAVGGVY